MLTKFKEINYPKLGKVIILIIATIEASIYVYLGLSQLSNAVSLFLSIYLLFTSLLTISITIFSIPLSFYYYHPIAYSVIGILAILSRFLSMIWLQKIYNTPSDELYLTPDGFLCFLRTALVFIFIECVLIFEKYHYYLT